MLKFFDPQKKTVLQCNTSMSGLGACLIQEEHPAAYASRAVTLTETNYAQIEKKLLAIVFGVERFEGYMYMAERSLLKLITNPWNLHLYYEEKTIEYTKAIAENAVVSTEI